MSEKPSSGDETQPEKKKSGRFQYPLWFLVFALPTVTAVSCLLWNKAKERERKQQAQDTWETLKRDLVSGVRSAQQKGEAALSAIDAFNDALKALNVKREDIVPHDEWKALLSEVCTVCFEAERDFLPFPLPANCELHSLKSISQRGGLALDEVIPREQRAALAKSACGATVRIFMREQDLRGAVDPQQRGAERFDEQGNPLASHVGVTKMIAVDTLLETLDLSRQDVGIQEGVLRAKSLAYIEEAQQAMEDPLRRSGTYPLVAMTSLLQRHAMNRKEVIGDHRFAQMMTKLGEDHLHRAGKAIKAGNGAEALQLLKSIAFFLSALELAPEDAGIDLLRVKVLIEQLPVPEERRQELWKMFEEAQGSVRISTPILSDNRHSETISDAAELLALQDCGIENRDGLTDAKDMLAKAGPFVGIVTTEIIVQKTVLYAVYELLSRYIAY